MAEEKKQNEALEVIRPTTGLPTTDRFDPNKEIEFASTAAKALMQVVKGKPKQVIINGEQYLEFEDWQTIARFYNITVGVVRTDEIKQEGKAGIWGFLARAEVYNAQGIRISAAEASCTRDEQKWNTRAKFEYQNNKKVKVGEELVPEFQMRSMAQTRASAKALRNVLSWVVVLAGFKPTPAEEMDGVVPARSYNYPKAAASPVAPKPAQQPVKPAVPKTNLEKLNDILKKNNKHTPAGIREFLEQRTGIKLEGKTIDEDMAKILVEFFA